MVCGEESRETASRERKYSKREGETQMKEVKVGIVGLGRLGSVHAQNLAFKIPGCKLVAAC